MVPSGVLSTATNDYLTTFGNYVHLFMNWGQWLFGSLIVINLLWMFLWYAIEKSDMVSAVADFLKRFFIIMLFYTFMIHPEWLSSILSTSMVMGQQLTHMPSVDPSMIVDQGSYIVDLIAQNMDKGGILHQLFSTLFGFATCVVVMFVFISVAIELAVTLIMTTLLISISTFFFGFAALNATSHIARQSLDVVLGYCIKLLGIYIVVGASIQTINHVASLVPTDTSQGFTPYFNLLAVVCLFWLLAKVIPGELGRIVAGGIKDTHGVDSAAIAGAAMTTAKMVAAPAATMASKAIGQVAKVSASTAANAAVHGIKRRSEGGAMRAAMGFMGDVGGAIKGSAKEQFGQMVSRMSGGEVKSTSGYAERMHSASKALMFPEKNNTPTKTSTKATFSQK